MTPAHLHLALNHLPLACGVLGIVLLAYGRVRKVGGVHEAALVLFVIGGLLTIPTYLSGEPSEGLVKEIPGVDAALVEEHEDAAGFAAAATGLLAVASFATLLMQSRGRPVPGWLTVAVLVLSLLAAVTMGRTANLGGRIHHAEVR
jgi:uncharacterized membrane protein (UPF0136 family)